MKKGLPPIGFHARGNVLCLCKCALLLRFQWYYKRLLVACLLAPNNGALSFRRPLDCLRCFFFYYYYYYYSRIPRPSSRILIGKNILIIASANKSSVFSFCPLCSIIRGGGDPLIEIRIMNGSFYSIKTCAMVPNTSLLRLKKKKKDQIPTLT